MTVDTNEFLFMAKCSPAGWEAPSSAGWRSKKAATAAFCRALALAASSSVGQAASGVSRRRALAPCSRLNGCNRSAVITTSEAFCCSNLVAPSLSSPAFLEVQISTNLVIKYIVK